MTDLIDFADVGPIPEPTIWTKPPLDLAALEAKIIGLTPQWPLPGPAEKAMRELIAEVRELRKDGSALAANQCIHTDGTGLVGDEGGNAVCLRAAPTEKAEWLIHKSGRGWYRPDARGYTSDPSEAGRYTYRDALLHSHPNGLDGPRDGMAIKPESEVAGAVLLPADDLLRQAVEALTNSCNLLENYIDTFGDMSGANRADLNDYRAVLTAYDKRGE